MTVKSVTVEINGQTYNLIKGPSGSWTTTLKAPGGGLGEVGGVYPGNVTVVNETGVFTFPAAFALTVRGYEFITDRTQYDVLRWQQLRDKGYSAMTETERAEWNSGTMKGAYNVSDLNRVGLALNRIRDRLAAVGYIHPAAFAMRENWNTGDTYTAVDLSYYLAAVKAVRNAITQLENTPAAPTDSGALNYIEANNIEKILLDVNRIIDNLTAVFVYAGEFQSGEIGGY